MGLPLNLQVKLLNHIGGHHVLCTPSINDEATKFLRPSLNHSGLEDARSPPIGVIGLLLDMHQPLNIKIDIIVDYG